MERMFRASTTSVNGGSQNQTVPLPRCSATSMLTRPLRPSASVYSICASGKRICPCSSMGRPSSAATRCRSASAARQPSLARGGLAPACDGALELVVEPDEPDGDARLDQPLLLEPVGPVDGRVVCDLGALEAGGGLDVLSGVEAMLDGQLPGGRNPAPREHQDLERIVLRSGGRGFLDEPLVDPGVHGAPGGVGMAAEVGLGQVPERDAPIETHIGEGTAAPGSGHRPTDLTP